MRSSAGCRAATKPDFGSPHAAREDGRSDDLNSSGRCPARELLDEEAQEYQHESDSRDRRPDLRLATQDIHCDRGAGRAGVANAAAPRRVAGLVRVLLLEGLEARP